MPENNESSNSPKGSPELAWLEETIPVSRQFDDPYYSKTDGLSETRHVFVNGNQLPARFQTRGNFTIGELGFGTGLNFIATAIEWQNHAPPGSILDFVSFEKFPISPADMRKALAAWPEITTQANKLAEAYAAALQTGLNPLEICWAENCNLSVMIGDADEQLAKSGLMADAWFLDGFSPSKNPAMWSEALLGDVFLHTQPGGTFATYTAAGWVRRNLSAAGFAVERIPGHAGKRQMMIGQKPL